MFCMNALIHMHCTSVHNAMYASFMHIVSNCHGVFVRDLTALVPHGMVFRFGGHGGIKKRSAGLTAHAIII